MDTQLREFNLSANVLEQLKQNVTLALKKGLPLIRKQCKEPIVTVDCNLVGGFWLFLGDFGVQDY